MIERIIKWVAVAAAAAVTAVGCGGVGTEEVKSEPPKVVSVLPQGGEGLAYERDLEIVISYDQNIRVNEADIEGITVDNGAKIVKAEPYGMKLTVTVGSLKPAQRYKVTVPSGIVRGNRKNQDPATAVVFIFNTIEAPSSDQNSGIPLPEDNDAWRLLNRLGLGWNLGNQFDAFYNGTYAGDRFLYPSETCWGNPLCTASTFTGIYEAGFRSVRIPVTWLRMIGDAPDYKIDEAWLSRIKEVVYMARDAGLNVIINTHHDEDHFYGNESMGHRWLNIMDAAASEEVNAEIKSRIRGAWSNIAEAFRDEGDYLIFESFNEINDGRWGGSPDVARQSEVLNEWNQVFTEAVRATGGMNASRWIAVPPYCAGPSFLRFFKMPDDPAGRTILAVHSYDPYSFTLAPDLPQKTWGHTMNSAADEKAVKDLMAKLYKDYVAKGIPVYLGEFGCSMREYGTSGWRNYLYYLEYFVKAAKSFGIPCFLWDNGNQTAGSDHHAYIDHGTGSYVGQSREAVDVMVRAMYLDNAYYTLQYVYDHAPVR